ncbi:hypothetical protein [Streptomyces erythrochromogenes]|uniref:hypothetical protein n=1 Tax=Streptomyces erythrochromogenes TaxID=285574 RepID=UPI00386F4875|nr:hypothetical protein OG489_01165 [Streptomyces erythrochromogenes]
MSPTIHAGAETLPAQSPEHLTRRAPFTGCPASHTCFHADPHGRASLCKVGRDPYLVLTAEGVEWRRPETMAATFFAKGSWSACGPPVPRSWGAPLDWGEPASYQDSLEEKYEEAPSEPWTVGGVLVGVGLLVGTLAFLGIWAMESLALFD